MKRLIIFSLMLVLFGSTLVANAQAGSFVTANVPFEFYVGMTRMPAGEYRVARYGSNEMLQISCRESGKVVAILSVVTDRDRDGSVAPTLTFRNYGTAYFLAGVAIPNHGINSLPKASAEREYAAKLNEAPKQVAVVAQMAR